MPESKTRAGLCPRLACPACRGGRERQVLEERDGLVLEGVLSCPACGIWYALSDGVPRMLAPGPLRPDDGAFLERWRDRLPAELKAGGRRAPGREAAAGGDGTRQVQAAFGHKWTRQSWWGMEGESARVMEEWLLPRYGWASPESYREFMSSQRLMLDAGCGLGREALRMAGANPEAVVVALELSECVDEAVRHARSRGAGNVWFVQGDLLAPPFEAGVFDFVLSEGVLHHTPDTRRALEALIGLLAPEGEIGFYVYRRKAPLREFADDHVRDQLQELTPDEAWRRMEPLTRLGRALAELRVEVDVPEDVEVLGIRAGRMDVQRLVYYAMFKCYWNERLTFEENVHVNFDWYYPRYAWRHTEDEVRAWIEEAGLRTVHESVEDSGITMRAGRAC